MRRHVIALSLSIVLLLVSLVALSCVPKTVASTAPTDGIAYKSDVKAVQDNVNAANLRIDQQAGKSGVSQADVQAAINASLADYVKKSDLDAAIAAYLVDHPAVAASTNPTVSDTGLVTFTTNPVSIPQIFTSTTGSQSVFYTMRILNGTNQWQYVKPVVTLGVASSYSARTVGTLTVSMSSGGCSFSQVFTAPVTYTPSPQVINISPNTLGTVATPSIILMPVSGCAGSGEFQIGAGQTMDILINIANFTTSDVTLWNISHSISSRGI
jgi:hypothetical protein